MNRRTEGLTISQAIDGFVKYKVVEGLSERTLESYLDHLNRFQGHVGNVPIADLSEAEVEDFLYWLRTEYTPQRLHANQKPLSDKTIYNVWVSLKSFFTWAEGRHFVAENPMMAVPRPKFQGKPVEPFTRDTGLRASESCVLRTCDVDIGTGEGQVMQLGSRPFSDR